jgi:hypothetical protein
MWLIARLFLFYVLLALLYYGYHVLNDKQVQNPFKMKQAISDTLPNSPPEHDDTALGYCVIDHEQLYNYNVYTYDNKQVSTKMSPIPCSTCNQYIYKDSGSCSPYMFDKSINTNNDDSSSMSSFCDPAHPERNKNCIQPHGVCSVSPDAKMCPFIFSVENKK